MVRQATFARILIASQAFGSPPLVTSMNATMEPIATPVVGRELAPTTVGSFDLSTRKRMTTPSLPSNPQVVTLDSGPVTLVPLDQFKGQMGELENRVKSLRAEATQLSDSADSRFADAGAILAPARGQWQSTDAAMKLAHIDELVTTVTSADAQRQEMAEREHKGVAGLIARLKDYEERRRITRSRNETGGELRTALIELAKEVGSPTTPEADVVLAEARRESATASQRSAEVDAAASAVDTMKQEIDRRSQAVSSVGFDALYELAWLKTYGAPPVSTSLMLHAGEVPYLSAPSTLARQTIQTHFVGSSQGFSFPIGRTGIRYRVGSFAGRPVQRSAMASVDSGELVLTNMRIAFIGRLKTISVNLPKIVNIHMYTDGLALFHEGKENADFFYLGQPRRFVFYLNYLIDGLGA
jgi:hypothetical protein